jgi:hypothetical protein
LMLLISLSLASATLESSQKSGAKVSASALTTCSLRAS